MDKPKALQKLVIEIENCKKCKTATSGKAVVGEGSLDAKIAFIGEAPGKTEAQTGRPFVGRSGKLLRIMIQDLGFKEDEVYITSPVKYLPNSGTPSSEQIAHGRIHLMKQFEIIQPKFVVLLGRVAAEGVLQSRIQVTKEHGKILEEKDGIKYFLTLHPAAVLRFPWKFKKDFEEDFEELKVLLN